MMALAAAFAVFFESIHWLKGGFGSLFYFGVFISLLAVGVFLPQAPWLDVVGFNLVGSHMRAAARAAFPNYDGSFVLAMIPGKPLQTFVWPGMDWSAGLILQRLMWLVASMAVTLIGSLFFDRFDSNRPISTRRILSNGKKKPQPTESLAEEERSLYVGDLKVGQVTSLAKEGRGRFHFNITRLVWLPTCLIVCASSTSPRSTKA
jgi:hypothetical protein